MTRKRAHLRILEPHDVIAAINRAGSDLLDPARHGYLEASESPWPAAVPAVRVRA